MGVFSTMPYTVQLLLNTSCKRVATAGEMLSARDMVRQRVVSKRRLFTMLYVRQLLSISHKHHKRRITTPGNAALHFSAEATIHTR
jgi:hypothetical protein